MYLKFLAPLTSSVEKIVNAHGVKKVSNQEIYIHYLVAVDHDSIAAHHQK